MSQRRRGERETILQVSELSKRFGERTAVASVSFSIHRGEIFGLLGPNGAGKTTTIGMIAGVVRPSTGSIRLAGEDLGAGRRALRGRVGLVPQRVAVYPSLSAEENLAFFARVHGLSRDRTDRRVEAMLELAGLSSRQNERVAQFSGGMKRRLNFVCGLVHEPDVLLLDEPTLGIDPQSRERIHEAMEDLARRGLALLLTTHNMEEAERLCHRLAILDEGRVVAEGTVTELTELVSEERAVEIGLARPAGGALETALRTRGAGKLDDRSYRLGGSGAESWIAEVLSLAEGEGNAVRHLRIRSPDLSDAFLKLTGKALRD